jgi:hypothetical protein
MGKLYSVNCQMASKRIDALGSFGGTDARTYEFIDLERFYRETIGA